MITVTLNLIAIFHDVLIVSNVKTTKISSCQKPGRCGKNFLPCSSAQAKGSSDIDLKVFVQVKHGGDAMKKPIESWVVNRDSYNGI